jgi:hypothetical protein
VIVPPRLKARPLAQKLFCESKRGRNAENQTKFEFELEKTALWGKQTGLERVPTAKCGKGAGQNRQHRTRLIHQQLQGRLSVLAEEVQGL